MVISTALCWSKASYRFEHRMLQRVKHAKTELQLHQVRMSRRADAQNPKNIVDRSPLVRDRQNGVCLDPVAAG
jgi:hypothetical protein